MDNNTSFFINHLIYSIYNSEDFENLKVHILESLRAVIPFECGSFCMANDEDPRHLLGVSTVVPERYRSVEEKYLLIEEHDISRWQLQREKSRRSAATRNVHFTRSIRTEEPVPS